MIGLNISSSRRGRLIVGKYKSLNVEIGTETPIFLFWEYLFQNFGILSLQCTEHRSKAKAVTLNIKYKILDKPSTPFSPLLLKVWLFSSPKVVTKLIHRSGDFLARTKQQ
jgi:hypothetical protein